jgi:hypothetical protein
MRRVLQLAALVAVLTLTATAGTVVLTFEGLQDQEPVLNYYNGGTGGLGSGPGPSDGITFGSDSLAVISLLNGGSGNFDQEPSCCTAVFFLSGPGDIMDVPAGFTTGFSFFYSANFAGSVTVYSGLDATGSVLATLALPTTPDGGLLSACGFTDFCPFSPVGVSFAGTAMSVDFSGTANHIAFDDITLGSATAGGGSSATPEPGAFSLLGIGLASLLAISLRQRKLRLSERAGGGS